VLVVGVLSMNICALRNIFPLRLPGRTATLFYKTLAETIVSANSKADTPERETSLVAFAPGVLV